MDTITHGVTGLALGALSQEISGVGIAQASDALMWTALVASQAPDFDYLIKLIGGKTKYLKYHRTFTHTLPVMMVLSGIITLSIMYIFPEASWVSIFLWSMISMVVHVVMDLTTSYGTKALWPINKKMLALDWVMVIDPVILLVLSVAVGLWYFNDLSAIPLFGAALGLIITYIIIRGVLHKSLITRVKKKFSANTISCSVIPTFSINSWNFIVEKKIAEGANQLFAGYIKIHPQQIVVEKRYDYKSSPQLNAVIQNGLGKAFKDFARHLAVWCQDTKDGTVVVLADLRFRFRDKYPFAAHIRLDNNLQVVKEKLQFSDQEMIEAAGKNELEQW